MRELWSRRVRFWEKIVWKKKRNCVGDIIVPKPVLLFDLEGSFEYDDCVTNFGWEWDRRSELDEK